LEWAAAIASACIRPRSKPPRAAPGFDGLGLKFEERFSESSYRLHFPDGNRWLDGW
jgi:hypothetical protein